MWQQTKTTKSTPRKNPSQFQLGAPACLYPRFRDERHAGESSPKDLVIKPRSGVIISCVIRDKHTTPFVPFTRSPIMRADLFVSPVNTDKSRGEISAASVG